jgi:hypothetical protein
MDRSQTRARRDELITLREASVLFECELSACCHPMRMQQAVDVGRDRARPIKFRSRNSTRVEARVTDAGGKPFVRWDVSTSKKREVLRAPRYAFTYEEVAAAAGLIKSGEFGNIVPKYQSSYRRQRDGILAVRSPVPPNRQKLQSV